MRTLAATCVALLIAAPIVSETTAAAAPIDEAVTILVEPSDASVTLGESLGLTVTLTNNGADATMSLVAHLDITDPAQESSVDPEDWTSTLSKTVGVLQPGASTVVTWEIQPISGGTFTVYTVALAPGETGLAVSNGMSVTVVDRRSLDPGGILPVAMVMPAAIGGLLVFRVRAAKRTGRSTPA